MKSEHIAGISAAGREEDRGAGCEGRGIVLVAETGSDLTPELAREHGVYLVPMYVAMDDRSLADGTFPVEEVCAYYERTGSVPKTCASAPHDFAAVFDEIHVRWPEKPILYLAYSAVTTSSFQNALLAAEGRGYVTCVDTKQVSAGQASVVLQAAQILAERPDIPVEELSDAARAVSARTHMCFLPQNLDYLRAGGRVSNATALIGNLLQMHPSIEIADGHLLAKKKYRGALQKVVPSLIRDFSQTYQLRKEHLYLLWSIGLSQDVRTVAEIAARNCGFRRITWLKTGCVITCHGGPGCFGLVGVG